MDYHAFHRFQTAVSRAKELTFMIITSSWPEGPWYSYEEDLEMIHVNISEFIMLKQAPLKTNAPVTLASLFPTLNSTVAMALNKRDVEILKRHRQNIYVEMVYPEYEVDIVPRPEQEMPVSQTIVVGAGTTLESKHRSDDELVHSLETEIERRMRDVSVSVDAHDDDTEDDVVMTNGTEWRDNGYYSLEARSRGPPTAKAFEAKLSRGKPSKAKPSKAKPSKAKPVKTKPAKTDGRRKRSDWNCDSCGRRLSTHRRNCRRAIGTCDTCEEIRMIEHHHSCPRNPANAVTAAQEGDGEDGGAGISANH